MRGGTIVILTGSCRRIPLYLPITPRLLSTVTPIREVILSITTIRQVITTAHQTLKVQHAWMMTRMSMSRMYYLGR